MKKFLCVLAVAVATCFQAAADEGMWLLPLIQKMNSQAMKDLGCRLTPEQIYSINNSSLKDAIVQFGGGCTGEMISKEGLLVTNHHCGYGTIQALSSPEHNYLEDGYWAMNRSQEIPAPGLSVTFLVSMQDVTKAVEKAAKDSDEAKGKVIEDLCSKAREANPHCTATVTSFYNENVYYLIVYKKYTDIRFVGAPPASSGKFGGETDNWMWPRHTCDFSMFRVYAGADNEPADYSETNVPYVPVQSLKVSLKGMNDGDFAMIMGYPGSTQRYQTAAQLKQMMASHDISIAARTVRQDIMWKEMRADDKVGLQYASKYASSSNGWKKWIGEKKAFADLDIIGREEQKEAGFTAWVEAKKKRVEKYGSALADIEAYVAENAEARNAQTLLMESLLRIEMPSFAGAIVSGMRRPAPGKEPDSFETRRDAVCTAVYKNYNAALDKKEAAALIAFYRENARPENYPVLEGYDFATMDIPAFVDDLFANSRMTSAGGAASFADEAEVKADPAYKFYNAALGVYRKAFSGADAESRKASQERYQKASKAFTAGLMEWNAGKPLYPDANFTMRLTYGSVKSYSPRDGVLYKHYTTLKGVMEKEDPDNYEFRVPARLKEIYQTADYGQYANADGEMPACFLINCDITGGNSGSPVMDADGCLVGLAFDGNWESMSSDVMFEPDLQRCICVDIRFVLLMMDKFGGAGWLLNEMEIVK